MRVEFVKASEKKKNLVELEEHYGLTHLPFLLIHAGKEKVRGFSGNLTKEEILKISNAVNVETIGMYLYTFKDQAPRINLDAMPLLKEQLTKRIYDITKEQADVWFRGNDLPIQTEQGFLILRHDDDLVGMGKSTGEKILNYLPKERTIKSKKVQ